MEHGGWIGRLIMKSGVAMLHPGEEGPIHLRTKFDNLQLELRTRRSVDLVPDNSEFRPTPSERMTTRGAVFLDRGSLR